MVIKKSLLLRNTNLLKANNPKNYALCCTMRFEPILHIPMSYFLQRKGYDYVARDKEITIVLELQNITLTDLPSTDNHELAIIRSDNSKVCRVVTMPEIPSGATREVRVSFPRFVLEGNIAIFFDSRKSLINNYDPTFDSRIFFTKTEEILNGIRYGIEFPPTDRKKIGIWKEHFYVLSLKEEIEEQQRQISFAISVSSFFISIGAFIISWLRLTKL